ncbi:hypothetical protein JCM24511_03217 [Saitozyma sp. JCM 24511]|nr:hypothetical protein JCM24511_03217 [Saitozyma sp. JCM 24511]
MSWWDTITSTPAILAASAVTLSAALFVRGRADPSVVSEQAKEVASAAGADTSRAKMAQASDPITPSQLAQYDGSDPSKPIYVAIKGRVFDVSGKKEMYGKGAGYNVFAGKDASKGLGMSSLDPKDAVSDYSSLNEAQIKTLDQWEGFFEKRYSVVGKVVAE